MNTQKASKQKHSKLKLSKEPRFKRRYRYRKAPAFAKLAVRSISGHLSRFLALFAIIALGAGVYAGTRMFVPDMQNTALNYFKQGNLYDLRLIYPLGFNDDDLKKLSQLDEVQAALGVQKTQVGMESKTRSHQISLQGIDSGESPVNTLQIKEGRLPQSADEIVISNHRNELKLGEYLEYQEHKTSDDVDKQDDKDAVEKDKGAADKDENLKDLGVEENSLAVHRFKIVGFISSAEELSSSLGAAHNTGATLSNYAYVLHSAFKQAERYDEIYLKINSVDQLNPYSESYTQKLDEVKVKIKSILQDIEAEHRANLLNNFDEKIDKARLELADKKEEASQGFAEAQSKIDQQSSQVKNKEAQLNRALEEMQSMQDMQADLTSSQALAMQEMQGMQDMQDMHAEPSNPQALDMQSLQLKMQELQDAQAQIAQAKQRIKEAQRKLDTKIEETNKELQEAERKIDDQASKRDEIPQVASYVLDRSANASYATYEGNITRIDKITTIFPFFFFLVAAFVTLITMTRMVESERVEIGSLKALGYPNLKIAYKYLCFGVVAALLGAALGVALGVYLIPKTIWLSYAGVYPDLPFIWELHPKDCIIAALSVLAITLGTSAFAIRYTLKEAPTQLMIARSPQVGKRILLERCKPLWRRLGFIGKVSARNLFRYKQRLIMTVLGVAGCTALLLTGFGIGDHIKTFVDKQFYEINRYDISLQLSNALSNTLGDTSSNTLSDTLASQQERQEFGRDLEHISSILGEENWAFMSNESILLENKSARSEDIPYATKGKDLQNGSSASLMLLNARSDSLSPHFTEGVVREAQLICANGANLDEQNLSLSKMFKLISTQDKHEELRLDNEGIIISQRLSELLQLKVGDSINLHLLNEQKELKKSVQAKVSGIAEFYVGHRAFISQDLYKSLFDQDVQFNTILAQGSSDKERRSQQIKELNELELISSISLPEDIATPFNNLKQSLNMMILLFIVLSGSLVLIVLYNLTNINIEERSREIATLKVLGFYRLEIDKYIFRENIALSVMGIILGLPLGKLLCTYIMRSAEIDSAMYMRHIALESYAYACLITLGFTILVMVTMHFKLKSISMVSSLKAVE